MITGSLSFSDQKDRFCTQIQWMMMMNFILVWRFSMRLWDTLRFHRLGKPRRGMLTQRIRGHDSSIALLRRDKRLCVRRDD